MIILINFNSYLGGGETLLVRFARYLYERHISFHAYCKDDSFIIKQLQVEGVPNNCVTGISSNCNYPYLSKKERNDLLDVIEKGLPIEETYEYLTFCLRDLYLLMDLNKRHQGSICHLILHNQDYRYIGRTILDGIFEKLTHKRLFNNKKNLTFNKHIISEVNIHKGLIPMSWIIKELWKRELGIEIPENMIVSLPAFSEGSDVHVKTHNDKKIIFIGRLVDFKFASLFAMFNFIKRNPSYQLSVVGSGDKQRALNYMQEHQIPKANIHFLGEIAYSDLPRVIADHSIGYAAGTSIIECAKQGIPVIMALQNNENQQFHKDICGGLFYHTSKGNLGEDLCLYKEKDIKTTIDHAIEEIEQDYRLAATRCYNFVKNEYSNNGNFEEYLNILRTSMPFDSSNIVVPCAGLIRRIVFKHAK